MLRSPLAYCGEHNKKHHDLEGVVLYAQMERFELSHRLSQSTPLAGEPLEPLGYICLCGLTSLVAQAKLAEREGFEPPVPFDITGFQDQRLKPLGHLSIRPISAASTALGCAL